MESSGFNRSGRLQPRLPLSRASRSPPKRIYHYVMTDELTAQSSIRCLRGRVAGDLEATLVDPGYRSPLRRFLKQPG
jgi:hypothetical protein